MANGLRVERDPKINMIKKRLCVVCDIQVCSPLQESGRDARHRHNERKTSAMRKPFAETLRPALAPAGRLAHVMGMSAERYTQLYQIKAAEARRALEELNQLASDVERCERTIASVMAELNSVNTKFAGPRTTQQDVEYLTVLLHCAKSKLEWEKKITGLRKRAPVVLESMTKVLNEPDFPPTEEMKGEMLRALQAVQSALERLQACDASE